MFVSSRILIFCVTDAANWVLCRVLRGCVMSNPSVSYHGIFYVVDLSYVLFLDILFRIDRRWLNYVFDVSSDDELPLDVFTHRGHRSDAA